MSDAPERIFAAPDAEDGWRWSYGSKFPMQGLEGGGTEYVRADLLTAAIARAERAESALAVAEEALVHRDERRGLEFRLMANKIECQRGEIRNLHSVICKLKSHAADAAMRAWTAEEQRERKAPPTIIARIGYALAKIAALKGGAK